MMNSNEKNISELLNLEKALSHKFDCKSILGNGSYGLVVKARDKTNGQEYAIKSMKIPIATKDEEKKIKYQRRELELLSSMALSEESQRYVTKYVASWEQKIAINEHRLCIQMELCSVNLGKFVYDNKIGPNAKIIEANSQPRFYQHVFRQILNGLVAIHNIGWIHRDIHPYNILIANPDPQHINDINVKIADFGLARYIGHNDIEISVDGTIATNLETLSHFKSKNPLFRANELVNSETYDFKVDVYSAGMMLYFVSRYLEDKNKWTSEIQDLKEGKLDIHECVSHKDDEKLCKLIKNLLLTDPAKRFTAHQAREYMFPTQQANDSIDSGASTIQFFARNENENDLSRCRMKECTLSAMKKAIESSTGVPTDRQNLREERVLNDKTRRVKIQCDKDVKDTFTCAAKRNVEVVVVVAYTLSAMKKAIESSTGVPTERQDLREELVLNDKTRRVKIQCDEDVKDTFIGAAKRNVEVVVMDAEHVKLDEDTNNKIEQVGSEMGQPIEAVPMSISNSSDSDL